MIVFLVGGESRLMDDLITKMEKEGHKTYLLTGKRDRRGKYRRVFERYDFPYDSESVQEIFSNVNPDLVLFSAPMIQIMTGVMREKSLSDIRRI